MLECALADGVDLIVTRDNDLLTLRTFRHIRRKSSADAFAAIADATAERGS